MSIGLLLLVHILTVSAGEWFDRYQQYKQEGTVIPHPRNELGQTNPADITQPNKPEFGVEWKRKRLRSESTKPMTRSLARSLIRTDTWVLGTLPAGNMASAGL